MNNSGSYFQSRMDKMDKSASVMRTIKETHEMRFDNTRMISLQQTKQRRFSMGNIERIHLYDQEQCGDNMDTTRGKNASVTRRLSMSSFDTTNKFEKGLDDTENMMPNGQSHPYSVIDDRNRQSHPYSVIDERNGQKSADKTRRFSLDSHKKSNTNKESGRRRSWGQFFSKIKGSFDQQSQVSRSSSFAKRDRDKEKELARNQTQDDSVVYSESKNKSVRTKPSRRGESFNIRRISKSKKEEADGRNRPSSWQQEEESLREKKQKRHSFATLRSRPESRSEKSLAHGDGNMQHTPNPDGMNSHASFHSLHGNSASMSTLASSQPEYSESQSSMALSSSMTSSMSWHAGPRGNQWTSVDSMATSGPPLQPRNRKGISFDHIDHNLTPKAYDPEFKPDYKVSAAHSMHDVRQMSKPKDYSPAAYSPYQQRSAQYRYNNNYENIEHFDSGIGSGSNNNSPRPFVSPAVSTPSLYKPRESPDSLGPPPPLPPKTVDDPPKHRPACESPPAPPVRDASSLKYKVNQSHEKYPSWPVAEANQVDGSKAQSSVRTNSWAPSTTTSQDFPKKPKMVYHPKLNPHLEEKSPAAMKKYFEEEKLKTETPFRADFIQDALARAEGGDYSGIHDQSYPIDMKGEVEINNLFNSRSSYPFPIYDRDGRGKGDKDYSVPSPPERDVPFGTKSGHLWRTESLSLSDEKPATEMPMLDELLKQYSEKMKATTEGLLPHKDLSARLSPSEPPSLPQTPPPLPQTAPPPLSQVSQKTAQQTVTIPRSPQHSSYTYIVRNKPCYNTSTQTEYRDPSPRSGSPEQPDNLLYEPPVYRNAEVQCDMDNEYDDKVIFYPVPPSPMSTLERRRTLKSDVSTQAKQVTEALTLWREKEAQQASAEPHISAVMSLSAAREQHRHAPIVDKMEHERRIPETIQEVTQEHSPKRGEPAATPPKSKVGPSTEADILQQIHEHSPSQTWMLRKLSQEFFGHTKRPGLGYTNRLGVHHERGGSGESSMSDMVSDISSPRQLSVSSNSTSQLSMYDPKRLSLDTQDNRSKHSSSDYFSDSEPPSGSREDVAWKPKVAEQRELEINKKTPPVGPRMERNKKLSLKKAYGIFDEIDVDRSSKKIGQHGKSLSTGSVLSSRQPSSLEYSDSNQTPPLSMSQSENRPEPMVTGYEEAVRKLPESPRKLKRTSSEQLRTAKQKERQRVAAEDRVHKLSDPESRKERRHSQHAMSQRQRLSDPERRRSDQDFNIHNTSSSSENRISAGSDVFQGFTDQVLPQSARSASSSSSLDDQRSRNSDRLSDPEIKKVQQQALLHFYEKKTGNRLSVSSMESSGAGSDRTTPKERMDDISPALRDRSPSPPPMHITEATKKSKSMPRDISAISNSNIQAPERRRSSSRVEGLHRKDKSAPSQMETYQLSPSGEQMGSTHPRSGSLELTKEPAESTTSPAVLSTPNQEDTSLTMLKTYNYSSSSSSSSSPTKTPIHHEYNQFTYKVTVNKNFTTEEPEEDPSPPVLPPRNYKTNHSEREFRPPKPIPTAVPANPSPNMTMDYDQTPKPDYYADQLRQQARRISSQHNTKLSAARMQYQTKPNTDVKMAVSVSRPVDRQPEPQAACAPQPAFRPSDNGKQENGVESPKDNIPAASTNGVSSFSQAEETERRPPRRSHRAAPVLEIPSPPPLSQLEAEDAASPVDEPPPLPPPPLPEETPEDPRLKLQFDEDTSANSSPRYPAESYMRYRNSPRQGFSGNYRRSSDLRSPQSPEGDVNDAIAKLTLDTSSVTAASQRNDNLVQVTTVTPVNKAMPVAESKVQLEQGPTRYQHGAQRNARQAVIKDENIVNGTPEHSHIKGRVSPDDNESAESPSVRKFVANFEHRSSHENLCTDSDRPIPPQRTKNKVSELKQNLLRRSNENLLNIEPSEADSLVTENVTKVTVVPSRAEITPNRYQNQISSPSSAERAPLQETHFDVETTKIHSSPIVVTSVSSPTTPAESPIVNDSEPTSPRIIHTRQKSQEEIDCEQQAAIVAIQVQREDKRLSDVILPPPEHKSATDYIRGLFDTSVDPARSPSRSGISFEANDSGMSDRRSSFGSRFDSPLSSPGYAHLHSRIRSEGVPPDQLLQELGAADHSLERQKEELESRIRRKLETLQDEKKLLNEEISQNDALGKQVTSIVQGKCHNRAEFDKYKLYVTELDKVMYLLLKICARLARTENSLLTLSDEAPEKERSSLVGKQEELTEKLDDAKLLKEGIDKRKKQVAMYLTKYLSVEEFADYEHFVKMKSKLTLEVQEIDDQVSLGQEQLAVLRRSMTSSTT